LDFDRFLEFVMGDAGLIGRLAGCATEEELFAEVLSIGRRQGFGVEASDLAEIVRANRRAWLERWTRQ
jgi:hypothetical protein